MTHPPADPEPIDIVARALHEHMRSRIEGYPSWESLDMTDPFDAGLIRLAYERARDFVAMNGGDNEQA